ncbi:MAG: glutathione S-transferase N-terminal domain-containing protein [Granulosicoccus sp.]
MNAVTDHPVSQRWKANSPEVLQLYSFPTPNGVKVSIALEELALPYEAHKVTLAVEDVKSAEFLSLNPNGKIPAIIDPDGPDGQPLALFESGAILVYLAEKTGKLLPAKPVSRYQTLQWVMWQMGGVGPMFGQYGFFNVFGGKEIEDPRPGERYRLESIRLLNVLECHLDGRKYMVDDEYSIADISIFPWIRAAIVGYKAEEAFELDKLPRCMAYLERCLERPAVQRGLNIPSRD